MNLSKLFSSKEDNLLTLYFNNQIRQVLLETMRGLADPKIQQEYPDFRDYLEINFAKNGLFLKKWEYVKSFNEINKLFSLNPSGLTMVAIGNIFDDSGLTKRLRIIQNSGHDLTMNSFTDFTVNSEPLNKMVSDMNNLEIGVPCERFDSETFDKLVRPKFEEALSRNQKEAFLKKFSCFVDVKLPPLFKDKEIQKFYASFKVALKNNSSIDVSTALFSSPHFNWRYFPMHEQLEKDIRSLQLAVDDFKSQEILTIPKIEGSTKKPKKVRKQFGGF